jgi:hypothetical protein
VHEVDVVVRVVILLKPYRLDRAARGGAVSNPRRRTGTHGTQSHVWKIHARNTTLPVSQVICFGFVFVLPADPTIHVPITPNRRRIETKYSHGHGTHTYTNTKYNCQYTYHQNTWHTQISSTRRHPITCTHTGRMRGQRARARRARRAARRLRVPPRHRPPRPSRSPSPSSAASGRPWVRVRQSQIRTTPRARVLTHRVGRPRRGSRRRGCDARNLGVGHDDRVGGVQADRAGEDMRERAHERWRPRHRVSR